MKIKNKSGIVVPGRIYVGGARYDLLECGDIISLTLLLKKQHRVTARYECMEPNELWGSELILTAPNEYLLNCLLNEYK